MKRHLLPFILFLSLLLAGCGQQVEIPSTKIAQVYSTNQPPTAVPPINPTATPTAFQPAENTPTSTPHPDATAPAQLATSTRSAQAWSHYPAPIIAPPLSLHEPMGILPQPDNQINILLLGSDQRTGQVGYRTDVILLVTINTELQTISLTSFPRDLYVYIPGWTTERLNTAQARGGFETSSMTFEYNFGVKPDHFAMINFYGFLDVIDSLNGIDVKVSQSFSDQRTGYGNYTVPAGTVHMDSETALWYVRARYTSSDFDRTRRQQEVLTAIFYRLITFDAVSRADELFAQYQKNVVTDITFEDLLPLVPMAASVASGKSINTYAVGDENVEFWRTPSGASVLLPDWDEVQSIMEKALNIK